MVSLLSTDSQVRLHDGSELISAAGAGLSNEERRKAEPQTRQGVSAVISKSSTSHAINMFCDYIMNLCRVSDSFI